MPSRGRAPGSGRNAALRPPCVACIPVGRVAVGFALDVRGLGSPGCHEAPL